MYDITSTTRPPVEQIHKNEPTPNQAGNVVKDVTATAVSRNKQSENFQNNGDEKQKPSYRDTLVAADELNSALDSMNIKRKFSVEESINAVVVKIIDTDDDKVIRQIPSEEAVKLSKNIKEMVGVLVDEMS